MDNGPNTSIGGMHDILFNLPRTIQISHVKEDLWE